MSVGHIRDCAGFAKPPCYCSAGAEAQLEAIRPLRPSPSRTHSPCTCRPRTWEGQVGSMPHRQYARNSRLPSVCTQVISRLGYWADGHAAHSQRPSLPLALALALLHSPQEKTRLSSSRVPNEQELEEVVVCQSESDRVSLAVAFMLPPPIPSEGHGEPRRAGGRGPPWSSGPDAISAKR